MELNEDIEDGLRREVREETGLAVEPTALTGVYKNVVQGIVALVFRCRATGGDLSVSSETAEYCWAGAIEVTSLADPAYAVRVVDALEHAAPPAIRTHDGVQLV